MNKLLLLFFLVLICSSAGIAQQVGFRLQSMMGTPVYGPREVAVDGAGNIYLMDGDINKLDSTGRFLRSFEVTPASDRNNIPQTFGVDGAGNLYVSSYLYSNTNEFIRKYSPDGQLLLQFGSVGNDVGQFQEVHAICVDATGNVYVADYGNSRLQCFDAQGNFRFEYRLPNPAGSHPVDVDVAADGSIYLLDAEFAVTKLSATGQFVARIPLGTGWASYDRTSALLVEAGGGFLVSASQHQLMRFDKAGAYLGVVDTNGNTYTFSSSTHTPLARDATGNIYATVFTHQIFSNHLYKLSPAGVELRRWGNLTTQAYVRQDEAGNSYTVDISGQQVHKYNAAGQQVLTFDTHGRGMTVAGLALDGLGSIYLLETSDMTSVLHKFDARGQWLADFNSFGTGQGYQRFSGLAVDATGNIYLADYYGSCVRKLNSAGVFLQTISVRGIEAGYLYGPRAVAADLRGNIYVADYDGRRVQKFSSTGQFLQQFGSAPPSTEVGGTVSDVDVAVDGKGNVYLVTTVSEGTIFAADGSGSQPMPGYGSRVAVNRRATHLLLMSAGNDLIKRYVSATQQPENLISGQIFHDANTNCSKEAGELPLAGLVVVAEPGNYYGLTDESGSYTIAVDTGRYRVQQLLPENEVGRTLQQSCALNPVATFRQYGQSISGVDFGNQVSTRPFLQVGVASNRRRRCARNTTTVSYVNRGYAAAENVAVTVALPPEVVFISANAPHTQDARGNYVFQLGTLPPNAGGSIVIQDSVVCGNPGLRRMTVCTKAWISPPNTYPPPPDWNEASMTIQGQAQADKQVRFVLRNAGAADMTDSLALRVYQNSSLALQHHYWLPAGDSLVLRVPAERPVVRVEAEQPAGHPTQQTASATVEVRALSSPGQANPEMVSLASNAPGPETAEDCQPILDSYDPNDKQVFPAGVTAQHYTPTGIPLHYRVRFQNTGSDDAYQVVVVDTLAAELDPSTLQVEAASHPYQLVVSGRGRAVLTFTFDNIHLPPSSRNEAASNGFVQFRVRPNVGLPAKTLVENKADIFFDYNSPVRTNSTANRLYDLPREVVPALALAYAEVVVSPSISQLQPTQGRVGTTVTLRGEHFASTPVDNQVYFNGVATPVLSATATTLTVQVPVGATAGPLRVTTKEGSGRSTQAFMVYQPPTITAVMPAEGTPGTTVTLTGSHFASVAAQDTVWFNGLPARVQQATSTMLQVVVPVGAATGKIRLATLGGSVQSTQEFVVWYPPTIISFSPNRGKAGTVITVTGTTFAPATRMKAVVGSEAAAILEATTTQLRMRVSDNAQTGKLQIQTPGGVATSATDFTFLPAPVITGFTPEKGSIGEVVTLTGRNLLVNGKPDTISLGGQPVVVLAATAASATIRVPKGARTAPFAVAGSGGRSESANFFTVLNLPPAEAITVYPNPAHGVVTLDWLRANFSLEKVQVYNALGSLITTLDLRASPDTHREVYFTNRQTGLYLFVIHTSQGVINKRVILY